MPCPVLYRASDITYSGKDDMFGVTLYAVTLPPTSLYW